MSQADGEASIRALAQRYRLTAKAAGQLSLLARRLADDPRAPTAVEGLAETIERHIADSLVALELDEVRSARVAADVGSGAGLPGLALAAALPKLEMRLVEAQQSKCAYIGSAVAAMDLEQARVVWTRAEAWEEGTAAHDLVLVRALGPQPVVLEYAAPLLALGGHLVEWRGRRDPAGERRAAAAADELGLRAVAVRATEPFAGARDRHLHVFEKVAATPARFPRRPGVAAKRPLGS
ncbi:MAG TPA: RsmG family class I SAM-dependent methyltransferase [Solirubrobacteraceae bacterium]|jgi:16S rRNA (guanine527-N7)-methyltransferase|nr:RsmG family class I SAM-dependent methyltransferase [Solirubrobacteraceae bacterium]